MIWRACWSKPPIWLTVTTPAAWPLISCRTSTANCDCGSSCPGAEVGAPTPCLAADPADENIGCIGSQRAVVRRIELVDRVPDPGIGDDLMRIAAERHAAGASRP